MIHFLYTDVRPLNDDELFNRYYDSLSAERQKKTDAFRFRKDKNLSLGAGILLDEGLKKYGLCEKEMTCGTYENQKPYFKNRPDIHFSVSHSGAFAAAAFSDGEIGIDIEEIKESDLKIAKRFFAEDEYSYLENTADNNLRNHEFYRLWTLKESFMKITGKGMQLPLDSFCIHIDGSDISVQSSIDDNFYFYESSMIDGFCASLCSHKKDEIIKTDILNF